MDFGSKTCGVALSDELLMTSQPVEIIRRDRAGKIRKTLSRIEEICGQQDVRLIVLGLPLNMDDSAGERVLNTMTFREQLERRTGLPIMMSDERGRYVDMIAASIILQEYMENHREELSRLKGADNE